VGKKRLKELREADARKPVRGRGRSERSVLSVGRA